MPTISALYMLNEDYGPYVVGNKTISKIVPVFVFGRDWFKVIWYRTTDRPTLINPDHVAQVCVIEG